MSKLYRPSHRALPQRFNAQRLADRIESRLFQEALTDEDPAFITRLDMFFLATADADGFPSCSSKGGDPGFVRVLDAHTILFPVFDGNGMYLSLGNASENPAVGILFIDSESPKRLRVNGTAALVAADSVDHAAIEARFVVRVAVRQVFSDYSSCIHRLQRVESSQFGPRPGVATPVLSRKREDWACDVLPACDPARDPDPR